MLRVEHEASFGAPPFLEKGEVSFVFLIFKTVSGGGGVRVGGVRIGGGEV